MMGHVKNKAPVQTIVYTIMYAVESDQSLENNEGPLDHLRQYGMAEVLATRVVNKKLEDVTVDDAPPFDQSRT